MDTHNVHANHIWLPVSVRAIGNAPVGSNSSGPAVIPSVSEGGTVVGERSIWGKRSLRPLLLVTGGGEPIVVRTVANRRGGGTFLMMGRLMDNVGVH